MLMSVQYAGIQMYYFNLRMECFNVCLHMEISSIYYMSIFGSSYIHIYIYATLHYMILNYITFKQITYIETYNTMQCNALEHNTIQFTYVHTLHTYIPT